MPADSPDRTMVPFSFAIPLQCQPTSNWREGSSGFTTWNIVFTEKGKVGFRGAVFDVPVFRTPESRPGFVLDESLISAFEQEVDIDAVLA